MWATWAAWLSLALYGFMVGVAMSVMPRDWHDHNRFLAGLVWPFSLPVWAGKRVGDRELAGVHRRRRSLPPAELPGARVLAGPFQNRAKRIADLEIAKLAMLASSANSSGDHE